MEPLVYIWSQWLYIPLYNLLMWLYTGWADYNIGVAVVYLTLMIRLVLLPFSVLGERGHSQRKIINDKLKEIKLDYSNDPVQQKIISRRYLKKQRIRHWPQAVVLGVQVLVLVLLYKVFITGISSQIQMEKLYPWVTRPDFVNTIFLGFDMARQDLILPAIVAAYLFAEIMIDHWLSKEQMTKNEQLYAIFFPAVSFLVLAILPSIKSIFILTSLIFSTIISMFIGALRLMVQNAKKAAAKS